MSARWPAALLLVLSAACTGNPPASFVDPVVLHYAADVEAGRRAGRVQADERDADVIEELARVLQERLDAPDAPVRARVIALDDEGLSIEVEHGANAAALDWVRRRAEIPGRVSFLIVAGPSDLEAEEIESSRAQLFRWLDANSGRSLDEYNALTPELGGPPAGITYARSAREKSRYVPLLEPPFPHWVFGAADLAAATVTMDAHGLPGLQTEMLPARRQDFAQFTGAHVGRALAIVVDGELVSAPLVTVRLTGPFLIAGNFDESEAATLAAALGSGSLRVPLRRE